MIVQSVWSSFFFLLVQLQSFPFGGTFGKKSRIRKICAGKREDLLSKWQPEILGYVYGLLIEELYNWMLVDMYGVTLWNHYDHTLNLQCL